MSDGFPYADETQPENFAFKGAKPMTDHERTLEERREKVRSAAVVVYIKVARVPEKVAIDQGGILLREVADELGFPLFVPEGGSAHAGKLHFGKKSEPTFSFNPSDITGGVIAFMRRRVRPVLYTTIETAFGECRGTIDDLIRAGRIRAVFPEAKPGDSGRQFWELVE